MDIVSRWRKICAAPTPINQRRALMELKIYVTELYKNPKHRPLIEKIFPDSNGAQGLFSPMV